MKNLAICIITIAALAVTPLLWAQAPEPAQQPKPQQEREADRQAGDTLTGCLTEEQGAFTLKTQAGENVTVTGSTDLPKHKNHTVKLTGRISEQGGKKTIAVSKLEHVSPACSN
jgi:hypothetical protein